MRKPSAASSVAFRPVLFPVCARLALAATLAAAAGSAGKAQSASVTELLSAVVGVKSFINPDGRTLRNLGREREGAGVVIDDNGLVVTIGYLMVEAYGTEIKTSGGRAAQANVVGYDHQTGFGLLQAIAPPKVWPMPLGKSAGIKEGDPVLIAGPGGLGAVMAAHIVAKREFAGSWEYLLDEAIFTAPPHPAWSGAALISREGKLLGIGSLIVADASGRGDGVPGNMFVPIDMLPPILPDLIASGRMSGPARPWLGVNTHDLHGRLVVSQVTPGGPAEKAGVRHGDVIVGVNRETPRGLADFYRKVWALGSAGATVPLDLLRDGQRRRIDITSMDRLDHLKLKSTF